MKSVKKVSIIGVGFMGGALALDLKEKFSGISVWGYARSEKSYKKLKKLNILDEVEKNLKRAVEGADAVALALPVEAIAQCLKTIGPFPPPFGAGKEALSAALSNAAFSSYKYIVPEPKSVEANQMISVQEFCVNE